jgi:RNA recognition motif-containing protein
MSKKVSLKKKEKSIQKESNLLPLNEEPKEEIKQKSKKVREIQNEEGISSQPTSGVVYVGHLPWGFIDSTLKKYFSQFGTITRIISPKSSKTGRSVGYAFIEFEDEETARIAAKTMNNYILFEKILKCSFVEDKKKYDRIFLKWKKKFEFKERYKIHCEKLAKKKSKEEIKEMIQGLLDREEKRREKMKELGIKYEYKGFKEIVDEYKKIHMNEINEKNKNRKNEKRENIKQKENQIKSKNNKKEKEEMELEENEEEENDDKFDEEEENEEDENEEEEEEIIKEKKINKNSKNEKKSNNKKIETIRKQKKLNELKKKEKTHPNNNKKQIKKGKK